MQRQGYAPATAGSTVDLPDSGRRPYRLGAQAASGPPPCGRSDAGARRDFVPTTQAIFENSDERVHCIRIPSGGLSVTTKCARIATAFLPVLLWLVAGNPSNAAAASDSGANATQDVLEHHGNAARSGLFVVPGLTWDRAGHLRRDPDFRAEVAGPVYAQPLYWRFPGSAKALLLVATERNLIYALDAETGATAWKASLGPPVPRSSLPCGDIDPLGITGTPVIDERSQAMYLDAMVAGQAGGAPKHLIVAVSLKDGSVLSGWPIDVEAALKASGKNFDAVVQNQRGAL
ncbi:MAG: PQQ-binding-like beta-propeller repeat protein, partial [Betaproteobacteria bacterium]|nr:PQQ-binding-like beta-propeller repeat protein [Betaproteobacteria bacterium]